MHKTQDKFKIKRKIKIKSLEAAICNVALFKSMKDKDFKDAIYISYCQDGVILEAINQQQWKKAADHVDSFLQNKKIELLIDGYDKQVYESLITTGLRQITRKIRQSQQQCPYINIIHYQKLRKSCQYMDKQDYEDPLKDWERKNKKNPNFAFLIVQPKQQFDEIKRNLLQYLYNQSVVLEKIEVSPIQLMYLLFYCSQRQQIKTMCNRKQIEIFLEKDEKKEKSYVLKINNFTNIKLNEYRFTILSNQSKITKFGVGLQVILSTEMKNEVKNAKQYTKENPSELLDQQFSYLEKMHGEGFLVVPYKKDEEEKIKVLLDKYTNTQFSKQDILKKISQQKIADFQNIQFIEKIYSNSNFTAWKAYINGCPFMVHEYYRQSIDIDTFLIYLDQLNTLYCTYLVRYYGLATKRTSTSDELIENRQGKYYLIFDYHKNTLLDMQQNDSILDIMQIGTIILQILYLINFLHSQQQPRCLGPIQSNSIYWPMGVVLPYLGVNDDQPLYSIQNDLKEVGLFMKGLIGQQQEEQYTKITQKMINCMKGERFSVKKCIAEFQQMLSL